MLTRTCVRCHEAKTIRGVWYVLPARGSEPAAFVCESCYQQRAAIPA